MKNNRIQFWRIVMTYVIAVYHFNKRYGVYTSGYIAVEFFFMVSGYLLADKYYRTKGSDNSEQLSAIRYVWGRYRKYWPHSAVAFFTAFLAVGVYRGYAIGDYLMGLATHLPELFLVNMLGFRTGGGISYNDITWFLSSLLIVSFLIWLFMKWNDRLYVGIVVPISVVLIYMYLYVRYGTLGVHEQFACLFVEEGVVRGLADMNMGIAAYLISGKTVLRHMKMNGIISTVCLLGGGVIMPCFFYHSKWDFLMLLMIFVGVTLAFGCENNGVFDKPIIEKWAGITLAIYLNHEVLTVLVCNYFKESTALVFILWFVLITVYSMIVYAVIRTVIRKAANIGGARGNI